MPTVQILSLSFDRVALEDQFNSRVKKDRKPNYVSNDDTMIDFRQKNMNVCRIKEEAFKRGLESSIETSVNRKNKQINEHKGISISTGEGREY